MALLGKEDHHLEETGDHLQEVEDHHQEEDGHLQVVEDHHHHKDKTVGAQPLPQYLTVCWWRLPGNQHCGECVRTQDKAGEEVALDRDKDHHRDLLVNLAPQVEVSVV